MCVDSSQHAINLCSTPFVPRSVQNTRSQHNLFQSKSNMTYSWHKRLPISCQSGAGQGKFTGQRSTFYHWATLLDQCYPDRQTHRQTADNQITLTDSCSEALWHSRLTTSHSCEIRCSVSATMSSNLLCMFCSCSRACSRSITAWMYTTLTLHAARGVQKTEIRFGYKKIRTKSEPSKNLTSVQMVFVHGTNCHHRFIAFLLLLLLNVNSRHFYLITLLTNIVVSWHLRRPNLDFLDR